MKNLENFLKIAIFCLTLLHAASSTPRLYKASDGRDYLIETAYQFNWYQAMHECALRGYQLLTIDSEAKNKVIIDLLKKVIRKSHNLWLGGNDEFNSSKDSKRPFFWSPTGEKFNFTYWSDNNPDNSRNIEHCVQIWDISPLFQWNDIDCISRLGFVCEENKFFDNYQEKVKGKCDAVKHSSLSISSDFSKAWQQQAADMEGQNKLIENLRDRWLRELHKSQNDIQFEMHAKLSEQEFKMADLSEELFKNLNTLQSELQKSNQNINMEFSANLSAKQNDINKVCYS